EVVRLEAAGVRRVAGAALVPLVEGEEPRGPPLEVRAEPHLLVVYGEVGEAPAEGEQQLAGVPVPLVLLDGVVGGLLREPVLQLEGADRQPVDEEGEVEGE